MKKYLMILALAGCGPAVTKEGCPIYATEMMQARTQACLAAYYAERAKAQNGTVTRCFETPSGFVCTSN